MLRQTISTTLIALSLLLINLLLFGVPLSFSADSPHNSVNAVSCTSCHNDQKAAENPDWWTRQDLHVCGTCHNSATEFYAVTHEKNGAIIAQCTVCHDPHRQQQNRQWKTASYLYSSTSDPVGGITATALKKTGAGWTINQWKDMLLLPNVLTPLYIYRIVSNTSDTIVIDTRGEAPDNQINTTSVKPGNTFAVVRGNYVKPVIGGKYVRFFRETGTNSFADDTPTIDGVCQVCHTATSSFSKTGLLEGPGHPVKQAGKKCTGCHVHTSGFKASCKDCHGTPPLVSTAGGPDGLPDDEGGTGSTTTGAHTKHAVTIGYTCDTCHAGGMPESAIYDKKVQIGFNVGSFQSGTYDGRNPIDAPFTYMPGNAGTTITQGGNMRCSSIYCHGGTLQSAGTNTMPRWDTPGTTVCGSCHGVSSATNYPTRGSHTRHTGPTEGSIGYEINCKTCHKTTTDGTTITDDSKHVNNAADWGFDMSDSKVSSARYRSVSSGAVASPPSSSYGACSAVYCHGGTLQSGGTNLTPQWGNAETAACGTCHGISSATNYPARGSHTRHTAMGAGGYGLGCQLCHKATTATGNTITDPSKHINNAADWRFDTSDSRVSSAQYRSASSGSVSNPPSTSYGSCSTVYCHSIVQTSTGGALTANTSDYKTPSWGGDPMTCTSCHGNPAAFGAHLKHAGTDAGQKQYSFPCEYCHSGQVPPGAAAHVDGAVNTAISATWSGSYNGDTTPGNGFSNCSNTYCHSKGTSLATGTIEPNTTPSWEAIAFPMACSQWTGQSCLTAGCHQYGYIYVSVPPSTYSYKSCSVCHGSNTPGALTKGSYPSNPHKCYGCHRFQPINAPDAPKANSHYTHTFFFPCNYCHYSTTTDGTTIANTANHANGSYDVVPDPNGLYGGGNVNFTYAFDPGGGKCTNINCHITRGIGSWKSWGGAWVNVGAAWKSGPSCYEMIFYNVSASGGTPPYTYLWDFGDGTTSTEQNPTHVFPSGATYTVTVTARDANRHPGTKTAPITPQPVNAAAVADFTVSVYGWTVTLTDLSHDPDYNTCGHTGPATLKIMWGDMYAGYPTTTESINLTDAPSNRVYTHTYSTFTNLPNAQIFDIIKDNAGVQSQKYMGVAIPTTYTVGGRVANAGGVGLQNAIIYLRTMSNAVPSFGTAYAYTDANGYYTIAGTAVDGECYLLKQPSKYGYTFTPGDQTVCAASTNVNWTSSP